MVIIEVLVAFAFFLAALGIGSRLLKPLEKESTQTEFLILSTLSGLGILSFLALLVALAGLLYNWVTIAILFSCLVIGAPTYRSIWKSLKKISSVKKIFSQASLWERALLYSIALLAIFHFIAALAPPSTPPSGPMDWDSLVYHFVIPKLYANSHQAFFIPWLPHANWPVATEFLYAMQFTLAGATSARTLSFLVAVLFGLLVYSLARRVGGPQPGLLSVALLASIPIFNFFTGTGYVDVWLASFVLASAWMAWRYGETGSKKWLVASALFAGFGIATKLTGIVAAGLVGLFLVVREAKARAPLRNRVENIIMYTGITAFTGAPWFLKTLAWTGNPIWPLYYDFFSLLGIQDTGVRAFNAAWNAAAQASGFGRGLWQLVVIPFTATFFGRAFNGVISPLFLALAPLALFKVKASWEKFSWLFASAWVVAWFFLYQEARFLLIPFSFLSIVLGFSLVRAKLGKTARTGLYAVIVLTLLANVGLTAVYKSGAFPVALGLENSGEYLSRTHAPFDACRYVDSHPDGGKILFIELEQGFYCNTPFEYDIMLDYSAFSSGMELKEYLLSRGFTRLIVPNKNTLDERVVNELVLASREDFSSWGARVLSLGAR